MADDLSSCSQEAGCAAGRRGQDKRRDFPAFGLLLLLVMLTWPDLEVARVVAGETPGCSFEAKVAAVQVYRNRVEAGIEGGWFGDAEPGPLDVAAVLWAGRLPDVVGGALYFIGPGDAARMWWLTARTGRWECPGTWVESWR